MTSLLAGSVVGLSLGTTLWPLVFLGVVVMYAQMVQSPSVFQAVCAGFAFGLSKMLFVLAWGWSVYPVDWLLPMSSWVAALLVFLYWVVAASVIASASAVAGYVLYRSRDHSLAHPLVLVATESLGALLYSVVFLGPGGGVNTYFSFGFVGYALAEQSHVLQVAAWGGVYVLSFFVYVAAVVSVVCVLQKRCLFLFGLIGVCVALLFLPIPKDSANTEVHVVTTKITHELLQQISGDQVKQKALQTAVQAALEDGATIIVLPEDSRFAQKFSSVDALVYWIVSQTAHDVLIYDSGRAKDAHRQTVLRGVVIDTEDHQLSFYDKQYLVPQGEYVPYIITAFLALLPESNWKSHLYDHLSYRQSSASSYQATADYAPFLFCFEASNPFGVQQALKRQSAPYVIHTVSHAWFTPPSQMLQHQLLAMLRVQAVWNQVPIVVAGNQFPSLVVTAAGDVRRGESVDKGVHWEVSRLHF